MTDQPKPDPQDGWQLVPVECTPDMVSAAPWVSNVRYGWKLMLAAAPASPKPAPDAMLEALEPFRNETGQGWNHLFDYLDKASVGFSTKWIERLKALQFALSAPVPPADGAQDEADSLVSVIATLKKTESQDVEFVMLNYGGSHDERRAFIRAFRHQMIHAGAAEMFAHRSPSGTGAAEPGEQIDGWEHVGDGTPLNAWLETKLQGEKGTSESWCRIMSIGDEPEWVARDGRTTVTHHSYAAPSHWRWPAKTAGPFDVMQTIDHDYAESFERPLYTTPPVRGDREEIARIIDPMVFELAGHYDGKDALAKADAILSLPVQPGAGDDREPTPSMRIAGGIAWAEASKTAETFVDCADACWKAMWDAK